MTVSTIDRIIRHPELTFEAERPPPPYHVQQHLLMAAEPIDLEVLGELCCFLCFDLGFLGVISLVQYANRWVFRKMARDLVQAQKRISYPIKDILSQRNRKPNS